MKDNASQNNHVILRGEYKIPHGKLVAVQLDYIIDHGQKRLTKIRLDGDFFIDGVDDPAHVVEEIENMLLGSSAYVAMEEIRRRYTQCQCVGLDAEAIEIAMQRAMKQENSENHTENNSHAQVSSNSVSSSVEALSEDHVNTLSSAWNMYDIEIIADDPPHDPAMHMALDEILAQEVADGRRKPTLRFWQWNSSAVVIGLHQSVSHEVNTDHAQQRHCTIVRRMTGGGAMFIEPGNTITYSLYMPTEFLGNARGYEAYKLCDEWILVALNNIGVQAGYKPINDITSPYGKIGGAAQRHVRSLLSAQSPHSSFSSSSCDQDIVGDLLSRDNRRQGAIMHHVTMAYDIDVSAMLDVLYISREKMADKAVKSAGKRVDPLKRQTQLSRDELYSALVKQAEKILPHTHRSQLSSNTLESARFLADNKYASHQWTYKIP